MLEYISRDEISLVSSSSGGIFSAYGLCADKLDYVEKIYYSINISKTPRLFWEVFAKRLIPNMFDTIMNVEDNLTIPMCFTICHIPLYNVRYYWIYGRNNRIWKRHLCAASNYPFLTLRPSIIGGRLAIDGGGGDNIPLYPLLNSDDIMKVTQKPDLIFVLHFDARYDYRRYFTTDIPIIDLDVSMCNNLRKRQYDYSSAEMIDHVEKSYIYGKEISSRLFDSDCSSEHFHKVANEIFLEEHDMRQKNFSVDQLWSWLNVIGRALRNDRNCIKKLF